MNILLSNDDGVFAPGISILANALREIGNVTVIAPDRNRSGASNSLTLDNPLRVKYLDNGHISVEGTPTDCVHLALTGLLDFKPDIVVSGINAGANLGEDVFYSGTVAAAMEGQFFGLPSIAISQCTASAHPQHYATAAAVAKRIVLQMKNNHFLPKAMLNVNVPDIDLKELQGFSITRLGKRHAAEPILPALDPRGHTIYWIGLAGPEQDAGLGTDFYAVNRSEVSITPLQLDLTHYGAFTELARWTEELRT